MTDEQRESSAESFADSESGDTDAEFEFYLKFIKPLVLNLTCTAKRSKAAAWLTKLIKSSDPSLRLDYLKLLIFVLQRKQLLGPFAAFPKEAPLMAFPNGRSLMDYARRLMVEEKRKFASTGEPLNYMTATSGDLKQYTVAQPIAKFGAHCYYAISGSPITEWQNAEKGHFKRSFNLDHSIFDQSGPSRSHVPSHESSHSKSSREKSDMGSGSLGEETRGHADDYSWIDKDKDSVLECVLDDNEDDDLDPEEGRVEIDHHLMLLEEELNGPQHSKANDYSQNVATVFGADFEGAIATSKTLTRGESEYEDGTAISRTDIAGGLAVVARDKHDNSYAALYKSMSVQDEQLGDPKKKRGGHCKQKNGNAGTSQYDVGYDEGYKRGQNDCEEGNKSRR